MPDLGRSAGGAARLEYSCWLGCLIFRLLNCVKLRQASVELADYLYAAKIAVLQKGNF